MEATDCCRAGTPRRGRKLRRLPAALRRIPLLGRLAVRGCCRCWGRCCRRPRCHAPHQHRHLLPPSGRRRRHAEAPALQPLRRSAQRGRGRGRRRRPSPLLAPLRLQFAVLAEQLLPERRCRRGCRESGRTSAPTPALVGGGGYRRLSIAHRGTDQAAGRQPHRRYAPAPLLPSRLRLAAAAPAAGTPPLHTKSHPEPGQSAGPLGGQLFAGPVGWRGSDPGVSERQDLESVCVCVWKQCWKTPQKHNIFISKKKAFILKATLKSTKKDSF